MASQQLASPCISICQINPQTGNCSGCYRTRKEIARWSSMSIDEQKQLLEELGERRAEITGVHRRKTRRRTTASG